MSGPLAGTTERGQQMNQRWRMTVTGLVQGVGYRAACFRRARELGLTGWVMNRPDGTVLIEAEGSTNHLEDLYRWAERGPEAARVASVTSRTVEPTGSREFEVIT